MRITEDEVDRVHAELLAQLQEHGGRFDVGVDTDIINRHAVLCVAARLLSGTGEIGTVAAAIEFGIMLGRQVERLSA